MVPTLTAPMQESTGIQSQNNRARKRIKRHPNRKGGSKIVSVYRRHNLVYVKCTLLIDNNKEATKKTVRTND